MGRRAAISDIVSDEDVPEHLKADPELWSGCLSDAWRENDFLAEFERAGFYGNLRAAGPETPFVITFDHKLSASPPRSYISTLLLYSKPETPNSRSPMGVRRSNTAQESHSGQ